VKVEENLPLSGFSLPREHDGGHDRLVALTAFGTRTSFSMPAKSQPAGISVSILDDDPNASDVFSDWIRSADGFSILSRHTAASSALAVLPNEKTSIVLLDIDSPDLSPFDCLRQLKPVLQQTQFVALITEEDSDRIFNALVAGATGYLLKRSSREELLAELKLIDAGGSPMNSPIAKKVLHSFQHQSRSNNSAELSPRETRILRLLANGSSHCEAAAALNLSLPIVSTYIRSIYEKLHLHAAPALAGAARQFEQQKVA
jgi:DNA-binding NarL/FixJ family response regulator